MSISTKMRIYAAASALTAGLIATISGAQPITVNGVSCTAANAVTVTYSNGSLNIVTGGCGTITTPTTPTSPPSIGIVSPSSGAPGDTVFISGVNLTGATVTIGGKAASITSNTGVEIYTNVPSQAVAGAAGGVVVTTAVAPAATYPFTVTAATQSNQPPGIASVSPSSGAPGTVVTINGVNLSGATVKIGGLNATVTLNSANQIVVTVPSGVSPIGTQIQVTTSVAPTSVYPFTVTAASTTPAPLISSVSPLSGPTGTTVTVNGTGFTGASVTIGGVAATITSNSATSITATVPATAPIGAGIVVVSTNAGNNSTGFTVTAIPQGADISIEGITLPNPSKLGNAIGATHQGLNGAGSEVNAYAMNPARCAATPALTRSWQHNINLDDYQNKHALDYIAMKSGEALSFKFTVGSIDVGGGFQYADAAASGANIRPGYMTVSETPCDFDTTKLLTNTSGNGCYMTGINGVTVNWANITGTLPVSYCRLEKGKTYYLNLRFQDARPANAGGNPTSDACLNGETCGGILQFF